MTTTIDGARSPWALGDYDRVARSILTPFGAELVGACGIGPGTRVLDVAAGTGNIALAAASAGADVVACDITPELLAIGRRHALERGLELDWVEADAQALPFAGAAFDVVTSAVGVMFAADHAAAARELLRVCRPGGAIGLISWPPDSWPGEFFGVLAPYAAAPAPPQPPTLWGTEAHVRELFGAAVTGFEARGGALAVDHFAGPAELCEFYRETFGPVIATYAGLSDDRRAQLDRDLLDFAGRTNRAAPGEPARYRYEYLRIVARRR